MLGIGNQAQRLAHWTRHLQLLKPCEYFQGEQPAYSGARKF